MSLVATLGGVIAWLGWSRLEALRTALPRPDAKAVFDEAVRLAVLGARRFIDAMHTHALPRYLAVIVATLAAVGFAGFLYAEGAAGTRAMIPMTFPAIVAWVILVFACAAMAWGHSYRLFALVVTSIAGLIVSLIFLQFSAPDLALTQISVEVVATILLLLALNLLPKATPRETGALKQWRDAGIAAIAGFGIAALAYAVMTRDHSTIADYYLANAKPGGGGTNVVNVILVDFRGFDTFGEIIVLCIAALVIFAMLDTAVRGAAARRLDAMKPQLESGDAHPLLFVLATRVLLPLATVVGIFIFLRGHNQPGGGFIAGLVVSIALLMQYMASGYAWAATRRRLEAHTMLGAGVLIAGFTGVASWLFGRPFLTSTFGYVSLPVVGTFELASAMAFDLGVFLAVVGTVMLALRQISRVEARAERRPSPRGHPTSASSAKRLCPARRRVLQRSRRLRAGRPDMELLVASGIGLLTAVGLYMMLRLESFPVILGLTFLSYAVNLFLFAMGRLHVDLPPIISPGATGYTDPLPQALVLTAIVISFGMTALIVVLALRGFLETGTDRVTRPCAGCRRGRDHRSMSGIVASHWVVAPVILPAFVAAFLILVLRHSLAYQRIVSIAATALLLAIAIRNFSVAGEGPAQPYMLGAWPAPFGIVLVLDPLSATMVLLACVLALAVIVYAATGWDTRGRHFHPLFQFQLMGVNGAFLTGDVFNLFVFFEVMLIASYGLMLHGGGPRRLVAGFHYVAINLVGSTLFLFAVGVIYAVTGTLNMADLAMKVAVVAPATARCWPPAACCC